MQVAADSRPAPLRPNPALSNVPVIVPYLVLAALGAADLAAILARLTFAEATGEAIVAIGGLMTFGFAATAREVPGCPPLLARFASAVVFPG